MTPLAGERYAYFFSRIASVILLAIPLNGYAGSSTLSGNFDINGGAGINMWTGGGGFNLEENFFLGPTWNVSGGVGGIEEGLFGDRYGLEIKGSTSGKAGFNLGVHATSGLVTGQAPVIVDLFIPDSVRPGDTIRVDSTFALNKPKFQTISPDFGFRFGMELDFDASVSGQACFTACGGFNETLIDLTGPNAIKQELLSVNYDITASNIPDSYDQKVILFRGTGATELDATNLVLGALQTPLALKKNTLTGEPIVSLRYGSPGQQTLLPVVKTEGELKSADDAVIEATGRADLLSLSLNIAQLANELNPAFPPLGGSLKGLLDRGNSPTAYDKLSPVAKEIVDSIRVNLLTVEAGVALGIRQDFTLDTPDIFIDLDLKNASNEVLQTYTIKACEEADITLPLSLFNLGPGQLTFEPTIRFGTTSLANDTQLAATPFVFVKAGSLRAGKLNLPALFKEKWELPLPGITVFEDKFDVNFTGTTTGNALLSQIDLSRALLSLGADPVTNFSGQFVSKRITLAPSVNVLATTTDVALVNTLIEHNPGAHLQIDHFLGFNGGSQLASGDIRLGAQGVILGQDGQIGLDGAMTTIHNAGEIRVGELDSGPGNIVIANAEFLPGFGGSTQGTVKVFQFQNIAGLNLEILDPEDAENRLNLVDISTFENSLDNLGRVDITADGIDKTRFSGAASFSMPGFQNASIQNAKFLNLVSGVASIESGLLQNTEGMLSVTSTLELRSHISGGEVDLKPGAVMKLYGGSVIDGVDGMSGTSAQIFAMGDTTLRDSTLELLGTSVDTGMVFTTDNSRFNEQGQPGVVANPTVTVDSSTVTIRNGLLENRAGNRLTLQNSTLENTDIAGRPESDAGTIVNFGMIDSSGANTSITRTKQNNNRPLPALINQVGSVFNQGTGTTVFTGGVLNIGAFNIANGGTVVIDAPPPAGNQANFSSAHNFVMADSVIDIAAGGELNMSAGAALVINGGDVDYRGTVLAGDIVQNSGTLLIDTAAPGPNAFNADLLGNYDQRGGTLKIGPNLSDGVFDISGLASLSGNLDLSVLIPGVSFAIVDGAEVHALTFGDRSGSFQSFDLPTIAPDLSLPEANPLHDGFYWLARYDDVQETLRFRLTQLGTIPVDPFSGILLNGLGDDAGEGDAVLLSGDEGTADTDDGDPFQIGTSDGSSNFGILELRDQSILNTITDGIAIEENGVLDAQDGSLIRANGDIAVTGGELKVLDDSNIVAADGINLIAKDIADVQIDSGYEVPSGGRLELSGQIEFIPPVTIFANTVSIGGALDLSREGNTEILVENFSSLVAGINGETSKWIAESDNGLPVVHSITINSRASLTIGNLEARARFDPVADGQPSQSQVNITLDFGTFTQTGNSGLLLGGPSIVGAQPNAVFDIVDGVFNSGAGVNRISNLGKIIVGTFGVARFNGDIELDGGQITVLGTTDQRLLLKGHDLTARDGAQVDLTYDFTVADGTRIDLSGRSALSIGGDFSLGSIGPGFSEDGVTTELLASGPGTMLTVGGTSEWANRDDSAFVAFTNGARGELQDLLLARGDSNPNPAKTDISHGTLLVSGGFDADTPTHVIVGSITASSDFSNTPEALIRVADGAILEMRSGDHFVSLGHFGGFDPFRIVRARLEVASGALFDGALATGDFILSDTADVVIDAAAFKIGGNLVMNGGQFFYQNPTAQSAFELPDDATITVKRFGVFNYEDTFTRDADLITIESGGRFAAKRLLLPTAELTVSGTGGPKNTSARLTADSAVIAATVTLEGSGVFNIEDRDFLFESAGALKIGKSDEGFDGTGTLNVLAGGRANVIGNIRIGGLSSTGDAVGIVTLDGGSLHQEIAEGAFPQDGSPRRPLFSSRHPSAVRSPARSRFLA